MSRSFKILLVFSWSLSCLIGLVGLGFFFCTIFEWVDQRIIARAAHDVALTGMALCAILACIAIYGVIAGTIKEAREEE